MHNVSKAGLEKPRFLDKVFRILGFWVSTALHGMQSRYSDENSACLSVKHVLCGNRFLYHMKGHFA